MLETNKPKAQRAQSRKLKSVTKLRTIDKKTSERSNFSSSLPKILQALLTMENYKNQKVARDLN